jgi:hypothetical protein
MLIVSLILVMPIMIVTLIAPALALVYRAARSSGDPIDDFVETSPFDPDPAAGWAVVDLHALTVAHFQIDVAYWTVHALGAAILSPTAATASIYGPLNGVSPA